MKASSVIAILLTVVISYPVVLKPVEDAIEVFISVLGGDLSGANACMKCHKREKA